MSLATADLYLHFWKPLIAALCFGFIYGQWWVVHRGPLSFREGE